LLRLLDQTHTHTHKHTHIRQDSSGRAISPSQRPLPIRQTQTNILALSEIRTRDPSTQAAIGIGPLLSVHSRAACCDTGCGRFVQIYLYPAVRHNGLSQKPQLHLSVPAEFNPSAACSSQSERYFLTCTLYQAMRIVFHVTSLQLISIFFSRNFRKAVCNLRPSLCLSHCPDTNTLWSHFVKYWSVFCVLISLVSLSFASQKVKTF
jgi:hypothetical protein